MPALTVGEQVVHCPICPGARADFVFRHSYNAVNLVHRDVPRVELSFWRCGRCRVVFARGPAIETSLALYEELYAQAAQEPPNPLNHARYLEWLSILEAYRRAGTLFESGFGRGGFLRAALEAGWRVAGNELSARACELARALGVKGHCGDLATYDGSAEQDLVVSLGAIEHTTDPHLQVRHYLRLLRPGGAVLITTPNYNSLSRLVLGADCRIFDPEHLFYFTPATLVRLLEHAGFRRVRCWTQNVNVHELVNRFRHRQADKQGVYDAYQNLRATIEARWSLRVAKRVLNGVVGAVGVGEEIYAIAERPA